MTVKATSNARHITMSGPQPIGSAGPPWCVPPASWPQIWVVTWDSGDGRSIDPDA